MKHACASVTFVVVVLAGAGLAVATDGWYLMLPPLDAVKQLGTNQMPLEESISKIVEGSPLSEWSSAKTFVTAEACESEVKTRNAAHAKAASDLARRADEAKKRGDQRMSDIAAALAAHRVRDAAALCIATNSAGP